MWLGGRLSPGVRFDGPPRSGDVAAWLAGTRAWLEERLDALVAADAAAAGVDDHGEEWTLAKVLRRLVYHALDHLGELDRRLARSRDDATRLTVRRDVLKAARRAGAVVHGMPSIKTSVVVRGRPNALQAAGRIPAHGGDALPNIAFGMLGAAGQLLARTAPEDRARVREECRWPFVALLAGFASLPPE